MLCLNVIEFMRPLPSLSKLMVYLTMTVTTKVHRTFSFDELTLEYSCSETLGLKDTYRKGTRAADQRFPSAFTNREDHLYSFLAWA